MKHPSSLIKLLFVGLALALTFAGMFIPTANLPAPVSGLAEVFGPPAPAQAAVNYNRQATVDWAGNNRRPSSGAIWCSNFVAGGLKAGGFPLQHHYSYYTANSLILPELRARRSLANGDIEILNGATVNLAEVLEPGDFIFLNLVPYRDGGFHDGNVYSNSTIAYSFLLNYLIGGPAPALGASHSVLVISKGLYAQWNTPFWGASVANLRYSWKNIIGVRIKSRVPPGTPTITSPANNSNVDKPFTVQVQRGALNHTNAADFQLQVDNNADFGSPEITTSFQISNTFTVNLPTDGIWHIRVRQGDTVSLASDWSASVRVIAAPPPAPILIGVTQSDLNQLAVLGWRNIGNATHYEVKLWRIWGLTREYVFGRRASSGELCVPNICTMSTPRLSAGLYEYEVQAQNSSGSSRWSNQHFIFSPRAIDRTRAMQSALENNRRTPQSVADPNPWETFWCNIRGFTSSDSCRQCSAYVQEVLKAGGFPDLTTWAGGNDKLFNVFSRNRNNSTDVNTLITAMRQHPYIRSVDLNVVPSDLRPGDVIFYNKAQVARVGNGLGSNHSAIVTEYVRSDGTPLLAYWNPEKYVIFNPDPHADYEPNRKPQYLDHAFLRQARNPKGELLFAGDFIVVRFNGADIPRKVVPDMPTGATLVGTSLRINSPVAEDWEYEISYNNNVVAEGLNQGNFRSTVAKGWANASARELNLPAGKYWVHVRHIRNGVASPWTVGEQITISLPPAPSLLAVARDATIIDTRRPTFRWTCSPLASRYEFTWWPSGGTRQTVTLSACTGTEMSYTPNVDMPIGGINWFVRAVNGAGSADSAYRWFEFRAPQRATPIYPWGQWFTTTRQPQMRFECGQHATSYVVQVRTDGGTLVHTQNLTPSLCSSGRIAFTPSVAFPNGNYTWSVTSVNAIGSVVSASANFRIMVQGIAAPIITSPANLQTLTTNSVTFTVTGGLPTVRYQLLDMGGNVLWTKDSGTSLTETLANGTYRIRAMNVLGNVTSAWSSTVMFSVANLCSGFVDAGEMVAGVGVDMPRTCKAYRYLVRVPLTGRFMIDGHTSDPNVTDKAVMRLTTDPEGRNVVRDIRLASTGRAVFWHAPNWWGGFTPGQVYYFWVIPQQGVTVHGISFQLWLYSNWPVLSPYWTVDLSSDHNWAATWWYNESRSIIISRISGDVEFTIYVWTNNGSKHIATANSVNGSVSVPVKLEGAPTIVEIRPRSGFGTYRIGLSSTAPSFVPR